MMEDKYIFIDRDGVINKDGDGWTEYGYITRWEDFNFVPGVLEALELLTKSGYGNVIISNQKCVGRGLMTQGDLEDITNRFLKEIKDRGAKISGVYYCLHLDEDECDCRKPKAGLFLKAQKELGIHTFEGKYFIGDSQRDMQAGKKVGLKTIFVLSGKSSMEDVEKWEHKPDHICRDLLEAAKMILETESERV